MTLSDRSGTIEYMHESGSALALGNAELAALIRALADADPGADDAVLLDRIRLLEELKEAASAAQARQAALLTYRVVHPLLMGCPDE